MKNNNTILIVSCYNIIESNTAGESRIKLYIKSLLLHDKIKTIFLYYKGKLWTFTKEETKCIKFSFFSIRKIIKYNTPVYIYPSTNNLIEIKYYIYFKFIFKNSLFYEANEVRRYSVTLTHIKNPFSFIGIKQIFKRILSVINEKLIKYYTGVITISDNITDYYLGINKNILQIPILSEIPESINLPYFYNYNTPFIITFTGTINIKKENIKLLLKAIAKVNNNIQLHLYGSIDKFNMTILEEIIKSFSLKDRVFYKGIVPQDQLKFIFKSSHLLILPRGYTKQNHYGFSTKLSEYLVSGRPVLLTNVSDNGKYIIDNYNGFIIEPDNLNILVNKINYIYFNYNKYCKIIPLNAIKTVKENFDYRLYTHTLYNFFFK